MTFTNTQTTELSLDQLDDISAGWIGGAIRGAAKLGKFARASNGIRSGAQAIGRTVQNGARTAGSKVTQKVKGYFHNGSTFSKVIRHTHGTAAAIWIAEGIRTGNWFD